MGLFKRGREKQRSDKFLDIPRLPELPKLPDLPKLPKLPEFDSKEENLPQLPRYPSSPFGQKLSQDMIKESVSGEKEEEEMADEFVKEQMMPKLPKFKPSKMPLHEIERKIVRTESKKPIFIRIDKFEESLKIFEEAKEKIFGMERYLSEIKKIKEMEDKELSEWEMEIQNIKNQIEKIERDVFSKV